MIIYSIIYPKIVLRKDITLKINRVISKLYFVYKNMRRHL